MPEAANRLLFDLTHALARQVELLADLLESHLRGSDAEEVLDDVALTLREGLQRTVHLGRQRLVDQPAVGVGRIGIHQHIQQRVVLAVGERSVDRYVAAGDTQRVGDLLLREFQFRSQLFGRRRALVLLLEACERLVDLDRKSVV